MSQVCKRCYKIVHRGCQSDTESLDCPNLATGTIQPSSDENSEICRDPIPGHENLSSEGSYEYFNRYIAGDR